MYVEQCKNVPTQTHAEKPGLHTRMPVTLFGGVCNWKHYIIMMACCFGTAAAVASFFYIYFCFIVYRPKPPLRYYAFAIAKFFFQIQQLIVFVTFIICQKERLTTYLFLLTLWSHTRGTGLSTHCFMWRREEKSHTLKHKTQLFFGILFFLSGIKLSDFFL